MLTRARALVFASRSLSSHPAASCKAINSARGWEVNNFVRQCTTETNTDSAKRSFAEEFYEASSFGASFEKLKIPKEKKEQIVNRVEKLEAYAKHWVLSNGVPLIKYEPPPFELSKYEEEQQGRLVITPDYVQKEQEEAMKEEEKETRTREEFARVAERAAARALALRQKYWGKAHQTTLAGQLLYHTILLRKGINVAATIAEMKQNMKMALRKHKELLSLVKSSDPFAFMSAINADWNQIAPEMGRLQIQSEFQFYTGFFASCADLIAVQLITQNNLKEAKEILSEAIQVLRADIKPNFIQYLILGRGLSNICVKQGEIMEAEKLLQELLDQHEINTQFHSFTKYNREITNNCNPIQERINTTIQLARVKQWLAKWEDAEVLLRIAIALVKSRSGEFSVETCEIYRELLEFLSARPGGSLEELKDCYKFILHAARGTNQKIMAAVQEEKDPLKRSALLSELPLYPALALGIRMFRIIPEEREFYIEIVLESVKAHFISIQNFDYTDLSDTLQEAINCLKEIREYDKIVTLIDRYSVPLKITFTNPSLEFAHLLQQKVDASLCALFEARAENLPICPPWIPREEVEKKSDQLSTIRSDIAEIMDYAERASNMNLHNPTFAIALYSLGCLELFKNNHDAAQKNFSRVLSILAPYKETDRAILISEQTKSVHWALLATARNTATLLGSMLVTRQYQPKRASLYFKFALELADMQFEGASQEDFSLNDPIAIETEQNRLDCVEYCLSKLILLTEENITDEGPSVEKAKLLASYYESKENILQTKEELARSLEEEIDEQTIAMLIESK